MSGDASAWLGIVGAIFGIVLVVATVVAYFRASLAKATIDTLKESNAALTERVELLESEQTRNQTKIDLLDRENGILREAISGKADLQELMAMITNYHQTVLDDRREFEQRFNASLITVGERIDSQRRAIEDLLRMAGTKRDREKAASGA